MPLKPDLYRPRETGDLSLLADAILAPLDRDPERPCYREDSFRRKLLEANRRAMGLPAPPSGREADALLESEWADIVAAADLTEVQTDVLSLRLAGFTFEEIGQRRGHTKQGAQNIFFQGAKKLARAWHGYPYRGLAQVYRDEVRRGNRVRRPR